MGFERQDERDLDQAALPVGQIRHAALRERQEAEAVEPRGGAVDEVGAGAHPAEHVAVEAELRLERERHVLRHRKKREERADLEGPGEAEGDAPLGRERGDVDAVEPDGAA